MKKYSKDERDAFADQMRNRTKQFAVDTINLCNTLPSGRAYGTIVYQLVKSSTSVGANYRAACRARSGAEFHSKLSIVVEESDESGYWLEVILDLKTNCDLAEVERLRQESDEITRIVASARSNTKRNK